MGKESKEMTVVRGLDLQRYTGRWYEIASIPSFFQPRDGVNTRATYTLNADGTVHVLNETWSRGKRDSIEGSAYKANPNSDEAKFKVKFYVPPFLPIIPVTGNYWVLYLDPDYRYALIGEPTRSYLWILSRTTHLDDETYNLLLEKAKAEGYDVNKLHKTPQADPPPESDGASPQDKKGIWWIKSLFGNLCRETKRRNPAHTVEKKRRRDFLRGKPEFGKNHGAAASTKSFHYLPLRITECLPPSSGRIPNTGDTQDSRYR